MAKPKPRLSIQDMESEIGYKIPTYSQEEGLRFYSDLHIVPKSDYDKFEREYQKLTNPKLLKSVFHEKQLLSRLPNHGTTKRIERAGESTLIYRHSREGLYRFSCDLTFDFGLELPLLFTEVEAARAVLVSELSVDIPNIETPGLFELPLELRLRIYRFAIPRGHWDINNMEVFDHDVLPRCLGDPSGYYFPLSKQISLLLASKRLRHEALPLAFRHTTFRLEDMDDLAKLLVAVGQIGRANIESLQFPWASRSDLQCMWEKFPRAEDNHLKLPSLHVSTCMRLLHQCSRLRKIRILFDEDLLLNIRADEFKTNEGIQSLCSMQGFPHVEILGLNGDIMENCPLAQWLGEILTRSQANGEDEEKTD